MNIGQNIRTYREKKGLSLTKLSQLTGFSISLLSQIERNFANPSINSLKKISDALGVQLAYFFFENEKENEFLERNHIVRANKRKMLSSQESKTEMYLLSPDLNNEIELLLIIAHPGGKSGDEYYVHKGEECGFVIQGSLEIDLNGQIFTLHEGDSMLFKSEIPHKWVNNGPDKLISVWAITPPSY
jgi:transcriptional regulator with XRE-family HTH domain